MYQEKYELTIGKIFAAAVRNNPEQIISYKGEERVTYREFMERVEKIARGLVKLGLKKGDRVAVLDWDTIRYLEAYYAVPMAGGVLHTVNIRYPPELIFYTMQHAEDRFVIIRDEFIPLIEKSVQLFDFVNKWIVSSDGPKPAMMLPEALVYQDLLSGVEGVALPEVSEDDVATTFYTSGTTGLPKGVLFTHRQIVLHTMAMISGLSDEPINLKSTSPIMPIVPMFHVHSWGVPYMAIMKGQKYVLAGRYDFDRMPEIMEKEGVKVSLMVPSILYMLMSSKNSQKLKNLDLRVVVGGGALSSGLAQMADAFGIKVISGYGMSETAPVLTLATYNQKLDSMDEKKKIEYRTKTGIPIPLVEIRVVDSDEKEVKHDSKSIGEIIVRSPWLTREYVKDEDNTRKLWKDDWMHTGDLAVVDDLGYLSIVDREKDAVKSGGEFIPTIILEDVISTYPGIAEAAVVAKPDKKWGERPVAFVSGLKNVEPQKIVDHMMKYVESGRIAKFWIPDEFISVDSFQKTSTGKIDKKPLRERFSQ